MFLCYSNIITSAKYDKLMKQLIIARYFTVRYEGDIHVIKQCTYLNKHLLLY